MCGNIGRVVLWKVRFIVLQDTRGRIGARVSRFAILQDPQGHFGRECLDSCLQNEENVAQIKAVQNDLSNSLLLHISSFFRISSASFYRTINVKIAIFISFLDAAILQLLFLLVALLLVYREIILVHRSFLRQDLVQ